MRVDEFDYDLPSELIAQEPIEPRDASRLLVVDRGSGRLESTLFRELPRRLTPGDCLVLNDTRVRPARLIGRLATGGVAELLLLRPLTQSDTWRVLARPARKLFTGRWIEFGEPGRGGAVPLRAQVTGVGEEGERTVRFAYQGAWEPLLRRLGRVPLPPYIRREVENPERYQTVYAREEGSAAAPTAGLHFTPELLQRVAEAGVTIVTITLHVGLGTFRPVQVERVEEHRMHAERYAISDATARAIAEVRRRGGRVIACGTTVTRTLEAAADGEGGVRSGSGWADLFIYPGYRFQVIDELLTNFHLPRSTLLMLVSAFAGRELIARAYAEAIERRFRFFSFGDAMWIR